MNKTLAILLAGSALATAAVVGRRASPTPDHPRTAAWYARLNKPSFTPPGPVFGGAWSVLYPLLGWAGYRLLAAPPTPRRTLAITAWAANVLAIGAHPWLLFRRKQLGTSTVLLTAEVGAVAGLIAASSRLDSTVAFSQVPLLLWAAFADLLNEELWRRN